MGKHTNIQKFVEGYCIVCKLCVFWKNVHSAAEEVSNKHFLYLLIMFLLYTSVRVVVEADLNGLVGRVIPVQYLSDIHRNC